MNALRFVMLGDLHYSDYNLPEHAAARERLFTAFFSQIAALKPDLVFAIGDTTNRGRISELTGLAEVAKACDLPYVQITGNHDAYSLPKSELAPFFLGGRTSASTSELYTSFDAGLARFVLIDTARDRDYTRYDGYVSPEQLEWLNNQIEQFNAVSEPRYLIAMGHHPIFGTTRRSDESMLNIANSDDVNAAFARLQRQPGFYFCGHNHTHSLFGPDQNNWYHVQTSDPLDCRSFRLITLTENEVKMEMIDFNLEVESTLVDFETARNNIEAGFNAQAFERAYGNVEEHNVTLTIS